MHRSRPAPDGKQNTRPISGDKSYSSPYRWVVLAVFMYAAGLTQFLWLTFAPVSSIVTRQLGISEFRVSLLASVFSLVNIVLAAPAGLLLDKKGLRFTVGMGTVIMAVSAVLRLNHSVYFWLFTGQLGIAIGQPFVASSTSKLAATWFDRREEAVANGLSSMAMFIGMLAAMMLTPLLVNRIGLRDVLSVYAGITVLGTVLFLLFGRNNPNIAVEEAREERQLKGLQAYRDILGMKDFIILVFLMFIGLGFFAGIMTWIDEIFVPNGFTAVRTGLIGGAIIAGGIAGAVIIPLLSEKIQKRKPFLLAGTVVGSISMYPFFNVHGFTTAIVIAGVIGFFIIALLPIILQVTIEIVGRRLTGTATGLLMLMGSAGSFTVVYLMEAVKAVTGSFHSTVWLLTGLFIIGILLSMAIKETYPLNTDELQINNF